MPGLIAASDVQQSPQYTAVNEYISKSSLELENALEKFCSAVEDKFGASQDASLVEEELTTSWKSIISIAAETPFTDSGMQKLVNFILELQSRPDLEKDGKKCEVEDMTVWEDLPTFGWQLRDAWNFAASDKDEEFKQQQWLNLNAWTASLVAAVHSDNDGTPDFSLYGIWTIRSALEESDASSETAIAAAAVWFIFAAAALRDLSNAKKSFEGKVAAPGSALKDQQWRGFTQERWQSWVSKLGELEGKVSDNVTKQLVQQARDACEKTTTR